MKKIKQSLYIFIILMIFSHISCYGIMASGSISSRSITTDMISINPLNYAVDQQLYATGGITFNYPAGWFSAPPFIQISVGQNEVHPTTETYVAEVSVNTATSTTVMVYKVSSGVVTEAPDSTLLVYLLALAMPSTNPSSDA